MPETNETVERGHFTMKAVATVTDQGVFEAVISTATIDREKDIVEPSAMVEALQKWNRPIPLAWNHSTAAEDIIGHIDPQSAHEADSEVVADGRVDLESKRGAEAWRSFKSGTIGFSYGYLVPEGGFTERKGGGKHITELDVFEVTATPTPMNNDTRVLAVKAMEDRVTALEKRITELEGFVEEMESLKQAGRTADEPVDPLREASRRAVAEVRLDGVPERKSPPKQEEPRPETPSIEELRSQFRELTLQLLRE
jgi:HK97 family phage prohead protease